MIRKFKPADTISTAQVWYRSGKDEYTYLPMFQALDEDEALTVFKSLILQHCEIWVYQSQSAICGFLAMQGSYIDRLYVDPAQHRKGVGVALLKHAMQLSPDGLQLHTHQQNHRARKFYEKSGFAAVKFGVSPAPESVPDVEYHWHGQNNTG